MPTQPISQGVPAIPVPAASQSVPRPDFVVIDNVGQPAVGSLDPQPRREQPVPLSIHDFANLTVNFAGRLRGFEWRLVRVEPGRREAAALSLMAALGKVTAAVGGAAGFGYLAARSILDLHEQEYQPSSVKKDKYIVDAIFGISGAAGCLLGAGAALKEVMERGVDLRNTPTSTFQQQNSEIRDILPSFLNQSSAWQEGCELTRHESGRHPVLSQVTPADFNVDDALKNIREVLDKGREIQTRLSANQAMSMRDLHGLMRDFQHNLGVFLKELDTMQTWAQRQQTRPLTRHLPASPAIPFYFADIELGTMQTGGHTGSPEPSRSTPTEQQPVLQ